MQTRVKVTLAVLWVGCGVPAPLPVPPPDPPSCVDACVEGAKRCQQAGVESCARVGACLAWVSEKSCATGQRCEAGACVACDCPVGAKRCAAEGVQTCLGADGCGSWSAAVACDSELRCFEGGCVPCAGKPGTFSGQTLQSGSDQRYYFLHVPSSYRCDGPAWPLVLDFHGTGGGGTSEAAVEEYYGTDAYVSTANDERFILVRPRSRWRDLGGNRIYQWDINPGDLARNTAYARELLDALGKRYHLDSARLYATGFSNGTNIAAQFLGEGQPRFAGVGVHAGGLWSPPSRGDFGGDAPRVYATTGFRDYMFSTQQSLRGFLGAHRHPESNLFVRESDTGHDLYGWHLRETYAFLARGERPAPGALGANWSVEPFPSKESLLEVLRTPDGDLLATASGGRLYRRDKAQTTWVETASLFGTGLYRPAFTDLCLSANGGGLAVGEGGVIAQTRDSGRTWAKVSPAPDLATPPQFGYAYLTTIACNGSRVTGAGFWAGVSTADLGANWAAAPMRSAFGYTAQASALRASPTGTWVAVGYYFLATSPDGVQFTARTSGSPAEWLNDVASGPNGRWWAVGEKGAITASTDDGLTWAAVASPTTEDLYAVAFHDGSLGMAVGAHGMALLTVDGGATWTQVSTGLNGFLGDVTWLDARTALAVGEGGAVLRYSRP